MPVLDIDIDCELILKPALFLMEMRLPLPLVNTVNDYIDSVRESAADFSRTLVGQIGRDPRSAQLQLDLMQNTPAGLADKLINLLRRVGYDRGLCIHMQPLPDVDHAAEMRKLRLLLESLI